MTYLAPPPDPPDRPALLNAFARILWDLAAVLGARARPAGTLSGGRVPALPMPLVALLGERLIRLRVRFCALVEQALAGTLKPVRRRVSRAAPAGAAAARAARAAERLPRAAGWLAALCPPVEAFAGGVPLRQIAPVAAALTPLLEDATLRRLLAADPRFGRALRPLWRMLRTDPPPVCLRLPARPRRPRLARPKVDGGRPIPRGVTRRDLRRSRAMAGEAAAAAASAPMPVCGVATDWTPTHLTLGRRVSVLDPPLRPPDGAGRRFGARYGG